MSIGIFYASTKGFSKGIAERIGAKLAVSAIFDIKEIAVSKMNDYEKLLLVISTHKVGQIQNDLLAQLDAFKAINWKSKTVAIVGLGNGVKHKDHFNDAMGTIYDIVKEAHVIGAVEDSGYVYDKTQAKRNGTFVGLALDEINQADLSATRIDAWLSQIKPALV